MKLLRPSLKRYLPGWCLQVPRRNPKPATMRGGAFRITAVWLATGLSISHADDAVFVPIYLPAPECECQICDPCPPVRYIGCRTTTQTFPSRITADPDSLRLYWTPQGTESDPIGQRVFRADECDEVTNGYVCRAKVTIPTDNQNWLMWWSFGGIDEPAECLRAD